MIYLGDTVSKPSRNTFALSATKRYDMWIRRTKQSNRPVTMKEHKW